MSSLEAKREQFRRYLERCGLLDSLCKALIKLYEEQNKPDDAIRFVRKYMCESCPDDDQFNVLKHDLSAANVKIAKLEIQVEQFRGNLKRTDSEISTLSEGGWQDLITDDDCRDSLLRKYLTREVFDELKAVKTEGGASLYHCIQSGLAHHDSEIGVFAADPQCFDTFKNLFDPIIVDYHKQEGNTEPTLQKATDWGNVGEVKNLDPDGKYIQLTRIVVARCLEGFPYFPILTEEQFLEIENQVKTVTEKFEGDLVGNYTSLKDIDIDTQQEMITRNVLFNKTDDKLATGGCYRFWPTGRGIFITPDEDFMVWVNEFDHISIISMMKSGDLNDVYIRLVHALKTLDGNMKFQTHPRYGYLSTCPGNVGTNLQANVHIHIPNLSKNREKLEELAHGLGLKVSGTAGKEIQDGVVNVTNAQCLGLSEFEIIKTLQDGVLELIKAEEELE